VCVRPGLIYSAFADAGLAVRAVIAGAEGVLAKATAPRALLDALHHGAPAALDSRALRAIGERLDAADLPILGMLSHGVGPREIAVTLRLEPEWLEARRWAMLSRLRGAARRHPLAAA
jgi:FixJ family two-component response regulator